MEYCDVGLGRSILFIKRSDDSAVDGCQVAVHQVEIVDVWKTGGCDADISKRSICAVNVVAGGDKMFGIDEEGGPELDSTPSIRNGPFDDYQGSAFGRMDKSVGLLVEQGLDTAIVRACGAGGKTQPGVGPRSIQADFVR